MGAIKKGIHFCLFVSVGLLLLNHSSMAEEVSMSDTNKPYYKTYFPNGAGKSIMTPTGWGASNNTVFYGVGGSSPQVYSTSADGAMSFGIGLLDPVEYIGIQTSITINDISEMDNPSFGLKLHRYLGYGISVALGGENLFHSKESDADESYYFVISRSSQKHIDSESGFSRLHVSLGVGTGRFGEKSELDILNSKGKHGTYVFGAMAYQVLPSTNVIVEWSGINLNIGVSISPFKDVPLVITLGAADLTSYSGDGARFVGSMTFAYKF